MGSPQDTNHGQQPFGKVIRWPTLNEEAARSAEAARRPARGMRDAIAFFDRIGWLTPLRLREGKAKGEK